MSSFRKALANSSLPPSTLESFKQKVLTQLTIIYQRNMPEENQNTIKEFVKDTYEFVVLLSQGNHDKENFKKELEAFLSNDVNDFVDWLWESMETIDWTPPVESLQSKEPSEVEKPQQTLPKITEQRKEGPTKETKKAPTKATVAPKNAEQRKADRKKRFSAPLNEKPESKKRALTEPVPTTPVPEVPTKKRHVTNSDAVVSTTPSSVAESQKKHRQCTFFPNCTKENCRFIHPTEPCMNPLNCPLGPRACPYIHPLCKFGNKCTRPKCAYTHPITAFVDCKHGFSCPNKPAINVDPKEVGGVYCLYNHPQVACHFGNRCKNPACTFSHAFPCKFGAACRIPGCTFSHSIDPTLIDEDVSALSATLPPSPPLESKKVQDPIKTETNDSLEVFVK